MEKRKPKGLIDLGLSILLGGVIGLTLGSVYIIEMDDRLARIHFPWYCAVYDVCHILF